MTSDRTTTARQSEAGPIRTGLAKAPAMRALGAVLCLACGGLAVTVATLPAAALPLAATQPQPLAASGGAEPALPLLLVSRSGDDNGSDDNGSDDDDSSDDSGSDDSDDDSSSDDDDDSSDDSSDDSDDDRNDDNGGDRPRDRTEDRDADAAEWARVEARLKALGYTRISDVDVEARVFDVDAWSPEGHDVDVRLDRETLEILSVRRS